MIDGAVCTDPAVLCRRLFAAFYGENEALEALKRRLTSSNTPIGKITAACGFSCESHAKRLFKKRFGMTMREWRAKGKN